LEKFWTKYKIKIASTLFAVFIWFLIVTGGSFDYIAEIPIDISRIHQDYIISSPLPEQARIRLRGAGRNMLTFLLFREGHLLLDFEWQVGEKRLKPEINDVVLTGNAEKLTVVELLEPDEITLTIEPLVTKEVSILSNIEINLQPGYTLVGEVNFLPERALIQGPQSMVDTCSGVATERAVWNDSRRPIRDQVELLAPDHPLIELVHSKVIVHADIQKLMERRIAAVPVTVINLPPRVTALVIPSNLSLVVQGGVDLVSKVTEQDIVAYIDYRRHRNPEQEEFPAYIEPLPGIRFREIEPKRFKVVLEKETS